MTDALSLPFSLCWCDWKMQVLVGGIACLHCTCKTLWCRIWLALKQKKKQAIDWKQSCFMFTFVLFYFLTFSFSFIENTTSANLWIKKKKECILNIVIHVDIFTFRFANQIDCRLIFDCIFFAGFILECLCLICHEQAGFFFGWFLSK